MPNFTIKEKGNTGGEGTGGMLASRTQRHMRWGRRGAERYPARERETLPLGSQDPPWGPTGPTLGSATRWAMPWRWALHPLSQSPLMF